MRKFVMRPVHPIARLLRDRRGIAMVEFGLTLPVLMILILIGMELTNYVVAHHRVRQIAALTADNASRLRTQMSEAYVNQLFVGVRKSGENMDFERNGRIILSSIQNNTTGNGQWIRWQRCFGQLNVTSALGPQNKGRSDRTLPTADGLTAQPGSAIMFAEVAYNYTPLFPVSMFRNDRISHKVAFIVRQRTDFSIAGTGASTC